MKRLIFIVTILLLLPELRAEDSLHVVAPDTLPAITSEPVDEPLDSIDIRLFEWMMTGLDTTA